MFELEQHYLDIVLINYVIRLESDFAIIVSIFYVNNKFIISYNYIFVEVLCIGNFLIYIPKYYYLRIKKLNY